MRVLIVDDEPAARRRLAIMLEELDVACCGEAANGVEAIAMCADGKPDVLLLDIAMPEVSGFDVVRHVAEPKPLIVFQTAYDAYALEAFEHEAVDYVLKPVTLDRLRKALDRARARLAQRSSQRLDAEVLARLEAAVAGTAPARAARVLVREGDARALVPIREVLRFTADDRGGGTFAVLRGASRPTDYTLAELEARTAGGFVRVSRADLVNADHIARIASNGDGSATLTLSDGTVVRVSRRRAADVRQALGA